MVKKNLKPQGDIQCYQDRLSINIRDEVDFAFDDSHLSFTCRCGPAAQCVSILLFI